MEVSNIKAVLLTGQKFLAIEIMGFISLLGNLEDFFFVIHSIVLLSQVEMIPRLRIKSTIVLFCDLCTPSSNL